jgi:hypothetical protein
MEWAAKNVVVRRNLRRRSQMHNFIERAKEIVQENNGAHDETADAWAIRAFSMVSLIGTLPEVNDEVGEHLAQLLSTAPLHIVMLGMMNANAALNMADQISSELDSIVGPEDIPGIG